MTLSTQQIFDAFPAVITEMMVCDMGAALRYGGYSDGGVKGLGVHLRDMIETVRHADTGPLTEEQKTRLHIAVWEWCASTAKAGLIE